MAFGSLQSHCHTAAALFKRKLVSMECPRGASSRTGSLLGENAHELLSRGQELGCNVGAMHQAAKGLADVGAAGAKVRIQAAAVVSDGNGAFLFVG